MNDADARDPGPGTGALIAIIGGFVIVGAPLVYILWSELNEMLAGRFDGERLLIAGIVFLLFLGLLTILSRSVRHIDERPH